MVQKLKIHQSGDDHLRCHPLIRRGSHSHIHSRSDGAALGSIWGSLSCPRTFGQPDCRGRRSTTDPPISRPLDLTTSCATAVPQRIYMHLYKIISNHPQEMASFILKETLVEEHIQRKIYTLIHEDKRCIFNNTDKTVTGHRIKKYSYNL